MSRDLEVRELQLQLKEAQFELKKLKFENLLKQAGFSADGSGQEKEDFSFDVGKLGIHNITDGNKKTKEISKNADDDFARAVYKELTRNLSTWTGDLGWDKRVSIHCPPLKSPKDLIIDLSSINVHVPLASVFFPTPDSPVEYPGFSFWLAGRTEKLPKFDVDDKSCGQNVDYKLFFRSEYVQENEWIQIYGPGTHPMFNLMNGVICLGHFINAMGYRGQDGSYSTWNSANATCEHYKNECPIHAIDTPTKSSYSILHRTDDQTVRYEFSCGLKWEKLNGDDYE